MKCVRLYSANNATIVEVSEPQIISEEQVKIRVRYCGIGTDDYAMYSGKINARYANSGLLTEFSGEIIDLGSAAKNAGFAKGDKVSAARFAPCGKCPMCRSGKPNLCVELSAMGCMSEIIVTDCHKLAKLSDDLPLEYGVFFEPASRCLYAIDKMNFATGDTVCILGENSTSLIMLQLLKRRMPSLVVVCGSLKEKRSLSLNFGADKIVDSSWTNLAETTLELTDGFGFDHIVDCQGDPKLAESAINLLARGGEFTIIPNYPFGTKIRIDLAEMHWKEIRIQSIYEPTNVKYTYNASFLKDLELKSLVGTILPVSEVNKAFELFATKRMKKIIIEL